MSDFSGFMHGVNLGGWLSQCVHTDEHYDTFITEKDIAVIKSWGLDHVRIPVDYELVEDKEGNYKESGFKYIEKAVMWCRQNGLNMILDLHKTYGYSFDPGYKEEGFFDSAKYQERFYKLWEQFASRFGSNGDMLAFELLNEVTSKDYCDKWNEVADICIKRIRKICPDIKILVGGYWNNSVEAVPDLALPQDENIIYNFHCYEPLIFTHQGAPWVAGMDTSFRMKLNSPYSYYEEMTIKNISQDCAKYEGFNPDSTPDISYFENLFKEAIEIAAERNTCLYCGEFGVIDRASPEETLEWYKLICATFDKYGIGRACWSYKKMDFGISDSRMDSVRKGIIEVL
ncbi:MAG: glycoside hydrolase family 5 protein [Clostridia bacterium]|nr:glycoside hydrolase family 5 protein [Clostridia bacterium]